MGLDERGMEWILGDGRRYGAQLTSAPSLRKAILPRLWVQKTSPGLWREVYVVLRQNLSDSTALGLGHLDPDAGQSGEFIEIVNAV